MYSSFKDNIWSADLADMQPLSKFNKEIKYLLSAMICSVNMPGLFF